MSRAPVVAVVLVLLTAGVAAAGGPPPPDERERAQEWRRAFSAAERYAHRRAGCSRWSATTGSTGSRGERA